MAAQRAPATLARGRQTLTRAGESAAAPCNKEIGARTDRKRKAAACSGAIIAEARLAGEGRHEGRGWGAPARKQGQAMGVGGWGGATRGRHRGGGPGGGPGRAHGARPVGRPVGRPPLGQGKDAERQAHANSRVRA
jgi:hypothetical protein